MHYVMSGNDFMLIWDGNTGFRFRGSRLGWTRGNSFPSKKDQIHANQITQDQLKVKSALQNVIPL